MPDRFVVDTDVCVDYLRSRPEAVTYIEGLVAPLLSAITVAELYTGVREGTEREALRKFVAAFQVLPVTESTAIAGGLYRRDFKGYAISITDAIIAATAEEQGATLVTLNRKHFPMLANVIVPYTKP